MKKLFGYDGILTRASEVVTVFVLSNLLTLICCIPIITIGSAFAANQKVMQDFVMQNSRAIFKTYFTAFWQNLGKTTALLLLLVLTMAFLVADFYCILLFTSGVLALVLYLLLLIVFVLVLGIAACCFSLIVRYENTLGEHLRNCLYLLMSNPGRIVLMAIIAVIPWAILLFDPELFIQLVPVWVFFGISLFGYIQTKLVKPLFDSMDETPKLEEHILV